MYTLLLTLQIIAVVFSFACAAVMLIQYFNVRTMRDGQIGYPLPRIVQ